MHAICINAKNKPTQIPEELWVIENDIYTVEEIGKDANGDYFLILEYPKIHKLYYPYPGFSAKRFAIIQAQHEGVA